MTRPSGPIGLCTRGGSEGNVVASAKRLGGLLIFNFSPRRSVKELSGELGRDCPVPVSERSRCALLGIPICFVTGLAFMLPIIVDAMYQARKVRPAEAQLDDRRLPQTQ